MARTTQNATTEAQASERAGNNSRSAFSQFTDTIRENPKTAIGIGAAVVAGATAAAVIGTRNHKTSGRAKKSR